MDFEKLLPKNFDWSFLTPVHQWIGVDIGSEQLKILVIQKTQAAVSVENLFVLPLPPEDKTRPRSTVIADLIKSTLVKNNIRSTRAALLCSGENVSYQHDIFPEMKKEDLIEAIRWKYKDQSEFPMENAMIDYVVLNELFENENKNLELFIVITPHELVDRHLRILQEVGLLAEQVSFSPWAFFQLWKAMKLSDSEDVVDLLLDTGAQLSRLVVVKNGKIQFCRLIPMGTRQMIDAAGRLTPIDFSGTIPTTLRNELDKLIQEIIRSLAYCREKYGLNEIRQLWLGGGFADLKGVDVFLANELKTTVMKINVPTLLPTAFSKRAELESMSGLFVPLAGLFCANPTDGMDFLPAAYREKLEIIQLRMPSLITVGAALLFFLMAFQLVNVQFHHAQKELAVKQAQWNTVEPVVQQLTNIQTNQNQTQQRVATVQRILIRNLKATRFLAEISQAIPPAVSLDEIQYTQTTFTLKGTINSAGVAASDLAHFIMELKKSPVVETVTLGYLGKKENSVIADERFEMVCKLKG